MKKCTVAMLREAQTEVERLKSEGWTPGDFANALAAEVAPEYQSRIDAERVTAEFKTPSQRPIDAGKKCIEDSPMFGGERQKGMFE
jgi:hypothetical protein